MNPNLINPTRDTIDVLGGKYRLVLVHRWEDVQPNHICFASLYRNHDDQTEDQVHAYFSVQRLVDATEIRKSDRQYVTLQAADFTYVLHRELYPELVELAQDQQGPFFCNTSYEFIYVHIPIHAVRQYEQKRRTQELFPNQ